MKSSALAQKLLVLALLALALVVGGCGGDSKSSGDSNASQTPAPTAETKSSDDSLAGKPKDDSPEAQKTAITATVTAFMTTMIGTKPTSACDLVSETSMKEALEKYKLPNGKHPTSCKELVKAQTSGVSGLDAGQREQGLKAATEALKSAEIDVDGDTATVTIGSGDNVNKLTLVKEDGRWKLTKP